MSTEVPPRGFYFEDPDTGFKYERPYKNFNELHSHVDEYREQNNLEPISDFRYVWEAWMCQDKRMEKKCCPVGANIKRNFEEYWKGGRVWFKAIFLGKKAFVSEEESKRRAEICVKCNQNLVNIGHSHSQFYSDKFIQSQVGALNTPYDKNLFTCKICTCLIRSKVHYASSLVGDSVSERIAYRLKSEPRNALTGMPHRCWQLDCLNNGETKNEKS